MYIYIYIIKMCAHLRESQLGVEVQRQLSDYMYIYISKYIHKHTHIYMYS